MRKQFKARPNYDALARKELRSVSSHAPFSVLCVDPQGLHTALDRDPDRDPDRAQDDGRVRNPNGYSTLTSNQTLTPNTRRTRAVLGASDPSRNVTTQTATGVVYGIVVPKTGDGSGSGSGSDPNDSKRTDGVALGQSVLDRYRRSEKVAYARGLEGKMAEDGSAITSKVLTYYSENTVTGSELQDTDSDGTLDPLASSGRWVGIARVAMTPLTLGYDTVAAMKTRTFSAASPMAVRLVSAAFSVSALVLDLTALESPPAYIGPVRDAARGFPCTVAYIPPQSIRDAQQVADVGDSYLVQKLRAETQQNKTVEYYFCGVGLTTRTRQGYAANSSKPLYEAGMQQQTSSWSPGMGVSVVVPAATHVLRLTSVHTGDAYPTNSYEVGPRDAAATSWTGEQLLKFQDAQLKTAPRVAGVDLPLWGMVQVQVPQSAIRGMIADAVAKQGGALAHVVSATLNIDLVLAVDVSSK